MRVDCRVARVTLGEERTLLRGDASAQAPGLPAVAVDTTGAGNALLGVLLATLVGSGHEPAVAAAVLPLAVEPAARPTEAFGAIGAP